MTTPNPPLARHPVVVVCPLCDGPATFRPAEGPAVWTSIFTGRLPRDHGVKSFASYRLRGSSANWELLPRGILIGLMQRAGLVATLPVTAGSRRCPALWDALNAVGVRAGIVRFWGTHPREKIQGFMLSNHFQRLSREGRAAEALFPPDRQTKKDCNSTCLQCKRANITEHNCQFSGIEKDKARCG